MNKYEIYNLTINDPKTAKEFLVAMAKSKSYVNDNDRRDAFVSGVARLDFTSKDHVIRDSLLEIARNLWYTKTGSQHDKTICNDAIAAAGNLIDNIDDLEQYLFKFLRPAMYFIDTRKTVIKCITNKAKEANAKDLDIIADSSLSYRIVELALRLFHPDTIASGTLSAVASAALVFLTTINHINTEMLVERLQNQPGLGWFCGSLQSEILQDLSPLHPNYQFAKEITAQISEINHEDIFV